MNKTLNIAASRETSFTVEQTDKVNMFRAYIQLS